MIDYPEGTIFIEIRDIYDGWSVAQLPDGTLIKKCAVSVYYGGSRVTFIGQGEVW